MLVGLLLGVVEAARAVGRVANGEGVGEGVGVVMMTGAAQAPSAAAMARNKPDSTRRKTSLLGRHMAGRNTPLSTPRAAIR